MKFKPQYKEPPVISFYPEIRWFRKSLVFKSLKNISKSHKYIFEISPQLKSLNTNVIDTERPNSTYKKLGCLEFLKDRNCQPVVENKRTCLITDVESYIHKYRCNKGESQRIWQEMYKVLDSSDVIIEVLDVRDPNGTRNMFLERHACKNFPHKHFILLLNKCDLVPSWVTKKWLHILSEQYPIVVFHSSLSRPFGKSTLLTVLQQISDMHSHKAAICIGFLGYPNVGKSFIINTLRNKKVCKSTPVPGETKVWQFVTIMKRIFLLDSPGVICHENKDSEIDFLLKGVIRVENIEDPLLHIPEVLRRIDFCCLQEVYQLSFWTTLQDFLNRLVHKRGRFRKYTASDFYTAARIVLRDWQRGRLHYFSSPSI